MNKEKEVLNNEETTNAEEINATPEAEAGALAEKTSRKSVGIAQRGVGCCQRQVCEIIQRLREL